ncbi:IS110 family RNA-guided transposase [Catalinimonas niigatensis]|uniref:IS110 family transposase n=1 Tax=Catalinimonas niigatensis TaxID=1397264 RepID=UPI002665744D|nr:IS110 family transposase [Catalinimonas niigatensis]WPP47975.1 IS110 family transposase [Catalinimonas niigatensis]WPP50691.1 IS110 family transposase [Catalinimonas niigatensis]WPP53561.1 IS110 family transposase [Catalinimonas niigatensis]
MKKSVFVGIDVSKSSFDAAIFEPSSGALTHKQFKNNNRGFATFLKWIRSVASLQNCLFCMEDTGSYSYGLACFLASKKADLCLESAYRIKHSVGIKRKKTDKADAEMIAQFAFRFADKLKLYTPPVAVVAQLKTLISFRLRLIKQKTSIITAIEAHKQLDGYVDISFMMRSLNQQLKALKEQIKKCNEQIDRLMQQDQQLHHQNHLLCSIPGVGKVIAAQVIAYTYGFTKFKDWRKFACYVGTAPFPHQSGTSIKKRTQVSSIANKKLKALLSMGAVNTLRTENEYHVYYRRKIKEGKHHMVVINAIRNKLISRMFAVIRRDTPYVKLQLQ